MYFKFDETCRGTKYANSIKLFQKKKCGKGRLFALKGQYVTEDKCGTEIKIMSTLLLAHKWKANSFYTLDLFILQNMTVYVSMQVCGLYVEYQIPNEYTRVGYLLDGIEYNGTPLQVAISVMEEDDEPCGKCNDFELIASHIILKNPVVKKWLIAAKRSSAQISLVNKDGEDGDPKSEIR